MSVAPKEGAETQVPEPMDPGAANSLLEQRHKIAVIIPCFNEGHSIAEVVRGFKSVLPSARIYVFDNNSTDETVAIASAAGALIRREMLQGKGMSLDACLPTWTQMRMLWRTAIRHTTLATLSIW